MPNSFSPRNPTGEFVRRSHRAYAASMEALDVFAVKTVSSNAATSACMDVPSDLMVVMLARGGETGCGISEREAPG